MLLHSSWTFCRHSSGFHHGTFAFHNLHFTFVQRHSWLQSIFPSICILLENARSFFSILSGHSISDQLGIHSLHSVQNKPDKLVLLNSTLNSTDCLKQLHWLQILNRIFFKIDLLTYRTLATSNPPYLHHFILRRHAPSLRSSSTIQLGQPGSKSHPSSTEASHMPPMLSERTTF